MTIHDTWLWLAKEARKNRRKRPEKYGYHEYPPDDGYFRDWKWTYVCKTPECLYTRKERAGRKPRCPNCNIEMISYGWRFKIQSKEKRRKLRKQGKIV